MRLVFFVFCFILAKPQLFCQRREKFISFAITNQHAAFPFSTFKNLFTKEFNPGVELGYSFNWKKAPKHDWYQAVNVGYFYHRFVQHAVPVYTQFGYRYKLQRLHLAAAIGAGYLHSIPATAVLERQEDGTYKNAKGLGRGQALILFSTGAEYVLSKTSSAPTVFLHYRQQLQTPFINVYVPLLPYNGIALGISLSIKK